MKTMKSNKCYLQQKQPLVQLSIMQASIFVDCAHKIHLM